MIELPVSTYENVEFSENSQEYWVWIIPGAFIVGILIYLKRRN
jgi:hypothetical protein